MITITETAAERATHFLHNTEWIGIRFKTTTTGCSGFSRLIYIMFYGFIVIVLKVKTRLSILRD